MIHALTSQAGGQVAGGQAAAPQFAPAATVAPPRTRPVRAINLNYDPEDEDGVAFEAEHCTDLCLDAYDSSREAGPSSTNANLRGATPFPSLPPEDHTNVTEEEVDSVKKVLQNLFATIARDDEVPFVTVMEQMLPMEQSHLLKVLGAIEDQTLYSYRDGMVHSFY